MAAVTHRVSTASTSNVTSYASGAFTPAVGDLLVVFVVASATVAAGSVRGTGAGLTFSKVTSFVKASSADTIYCFVADAFVTAAASQTVTFDCTGDAATGAIIEVASVSGMTWKGLNAIRQSAGQSNQASGGTPAPAFASAALTGNPTLGVVGNATNAATLTPPTSWTERADTGYATPTTGCEYVSRDSGFTGTTVTWGSTSGSAFGSLIIELDASVPQSSYYDIVSARSGLLHYWPGWDPSGTAMTDAAGNLTLALSGTFSQAQPTLVAGDPYTTTTFSAGGTGLASSGFDALGDGPWTMLVWMARANTTHQTPNEQVMFFATGGANWAAMNVDHDADNVWWCLQSNGSVLAKVNAIADTLPHQLVWTKNGSTNHIYFDGIETTATITDVTLGSSTNLRIGTDTVDHFYGRLAVQVYNVVLTAEQIADDFTCGMDGRAFLPAPTYQPWLAQ